MGMAAVTPWLDYYLQHDRYDRYAGLPGELELELAVVRVLVLLRQESQHARRPLDPLRLRATRNSKASFCTSSYNNTQTQ